VYYIKIALERRMFSIYLPRESVIDFDLEPASIIIYSYQRRHCLDENINISMASYACYDDTSEHSPSTCQSR